MNTSPMVTDHPGGYRVYEHTDGRCTIAWSGEWLEGVYDSVEAALTAGRLQVGEAGGSGP